MKRRRRPTQIRKSLCSGHNHVNNNNSYAHNNRIPDTKGNQQRGKQNNKKFYPKKSNPSTTQGNSGNSGNGKFCSYCKKLNHSEEECRKRMRDNKPCVTNEGKLYWLKINSSAENKDPNNVGAVFQ
jgi:hypothetical protein